MERFEVVICVSGGLVQDVFSSDSDIDVTIVDWDCQSDDEGAVEIPGQRFPQHAVVTRLDPQPLSRLAGSDVEAAIEASESAGLQQAVA